MAVDDTLSKEKASPCCIRIAGKRFLPLVTTILAYKHTYLSNVTPFPTNTNGESFVLALPK